MGIKAFLSSVCPSKLTDLRVVLGNISPIWVHSPLSIHIFGKERGKQRLEYGMGFNPKLCDMFLINKCLPEPKL